MGVSAVGETGIRPRTVRLLFFTTLAVLAGTVYLVGPPVVPGLKQAAADQCNVMHGANYRSYRLEWILPKHPNWDRPHWVCKDARDLDEPGVNLGWWVSPWQDVQPDPVS